MFILLLLLLLLLLLNYGHSLSKDEKSYNPIEFWDRLLISINRENILMITFHK